MQCMCEFKAERIDNLSRAEFQCVGRQFPEATVKTIATRPELWNLEYTVMQTRALRALSFGLLPWQSGQPRMAALLSDRHLCY